MGPEIIFFSFKSHISRIFMCLGCILIGINHFNHLEQLSWFFISWKWAKKLINSPKLVIYAALITSFLAPRTLWVLKKCFFGYPRPLTSTWSQKEQHVRTSKFPWLRTQCHTIRSLILLSLRFYLTMTTTLLVFCFPKRYFLQHQKYLSQLKLLNYLSLALQIWIHFLYIVYDAFSASE